MRPVAPAAPPFRPHRAGSLWTVLDLRRHKALSSPGFVPLGGLRRACVDKVLAEQESVKGRADNGLPTNGPASASLSTNGAASTDAPFASCMERARLTNSAEPPTQIHGPAQSAQCNALLALHAPARPCAFMPHPRTATVTSTASLRAFVETARWQSFTRAAETLFLTQSAVSKQVQILEQQVGAQLFRRSAKGLSLTPAGSAYLTHACEALATLEAGEARARQLTGGPPAAGTVELSASPALAAYWLIPLLPGFVSASPTTRILLRPRMPDFQRASERFDLEIRLGRGRWTEGHARYLLGQEMSLVASPRLLAGRSVKSPQDLTGLPLLQRAQRGYEWSEWAEAAAPRWDRSGCPELLFEGFSVLVPAVIAGCGLAICPLFMVIDALQRGELVRPLGECVTSASAYYAVTPTSSSRNLALEHLLEWLLAEAARTSERVHGYLRTART
jgi:LysR family transcriptional regulator, glycine cleavage system transcriptional activator